MPWKRALCSILLVVFGLLAAGNPCEPSPAAQKALDQLNEKTRDMPYAERLSYQRKAYEDLLKQYPAEISIERRYIDLFKNELTDQLPDLQKRYRERAAANPKDATAAYLAGVTLVSYHTPEALTLLEDAKKLDPGLGWVYLTLSNAYSRGKYGDKAKSAENIASYFRACPAATYSWALSLMGQHGTPEAQSAAAKGLREHLADQTDSKKLVLYSDLWGMEFRSHPVPEHAALRKQVAADLKRLEALNPKPDAEWLDFLKGGYKQSGASTAEIDALDDRIVKEFPDSDQALRIVRDRWNKVHPAPKAEDSAETWDQYFETAIAAYQQWIGQFPKQDGLNRSLAYYRSQLPSTPPGVAAKSIEDSLHTQEQNWGPDSYARGDAAEFYLKHNFRPERALELALGAKETLDKEWNERWANDDRTPKQEEDLRKEAAQSARDFQNLLLRAYRANHKVEETRALKPKLQGPAPADATEAMLYWWNLALAAEIESHDTDALTYYHGAIEARTKPPGKQYGRANDPLLDDARKLFLTSGGSESAWNVWRQRPAAKSATETDASWKPATKPMPAFELADLTGKTWSLKALEGKTVLITVWASW